MFSIPFLILNLVGYVFFLVIPVFRSLFDFVRFFTNDVADEAVDILDDYSLPSMDRIREKVTWSEGLYMGLGPVLGVLFSYVFQSELEPFSLSLMPSIAVLILIPWSCYWLSRLGKTWISPLLYAVLPIGMLIGVPVYFIIGLHFISPVSAMGAMVFPYLGFALIAPIPAMLYVIRELKRHSLFFDVKMDKLWYHPMGHTSYYHFLSARNWINRPVFYLIAGVSFLGLYAMLSLINQDWFFFITALQDSSDFLFSVLEPKW